MVPVMSGPRRTPEELGGGGDGGEGGTCMLRAGWKGGRACARAVFLSERFCARMHPPCCNQRVIWHAASTMQRAIGGG
eukprot:8621732-Pyramimonas_sp.AAC.1